MPVHSSMPSMPSLLFFAPIFYVYNLAYGQLRCPLSAVRRPVPPFWAVAVRCAPLIAGREEKKIANCHCLSTINWYYIASYSTLLCSFFVLYTSSQYSIRTSLFFVVYYSTLPNLQASNSSCPIINYNRIHHWLIDWLTQTSMSKPADISQIDTPIDPASYPESASRLEHTDTTESNLRYAAYANRFRTILLASHRYIAYTSDIGESFRPVAHPYLVKFGYGVSWAYILGDVAFESWKAKLRQEGRYVPGLMPWSGSDIPAKDSEVARFKLQQIEKLGAKDNLPDWKEVALQRGIFQSVASMGLPAFTIHSSVKYSAKYLFTKERFANSAKIRSFGPVAVGLAVVPVLPYLFDEPVEHALDYVFAQSRQFFRSEATAIDKKLD